ncbi:MAG: amidohydrolase family protein [Duganella sp.]
MKLKSLPVALSAALVCLSSAAMARDVVVHAGHLIDAVSGQVADRMSILIANDRITAVQRGFVSPAGAEVVDLSRATVLPGLIDAHVHMAHGVIGSETNSLARRFTTSSADLAFRTVGNASMLLNLGFTSVRDLGTTTEVIVGLKKAIAQGLIAGPRLYVSGNMLGPTGGHSDKRNGLDPELDHAHWDEAVIDGADEAVKAVRRLHREGADLVKIMPSGGVLSINDDPKRTTMTDAEVGAVVTTAHALGMKVAAHAHGKDAIEQASRLGADSVEHVTFGEADSFQLMKKNGTYFVPTLLVANRGLKIALEHPERLPPSSAAKARLVAPGTIKNTGAAYRAGVKMAFGTDQTGGNGEEFALLVQAGIKPIDAILMATRNAADLIGASQDIGSIAPGRYADLIAVRDDPLTNIRTLENVAFVMQGGKIIKPLAD